MVFQLPSTSTISTMRGKRRFDVSIAVNETDAGARLAAEAGTALPDRAALSDADVRSFLGRRGRRPYILAPWSTRRVVPLGTRRTQ